MSEGGPPERWEKVCWHGWDALRAVSGDCEMIVGYSAGPRVLSLSWRGGPNLLHRDLTDFGVGAWRLFGGHRVSVAPEGEESYRPDGLPCQVRRDAVRLIVAEPPGPWPWRRSLIITPAADGDGFDVENRLENMSERAGRGAVWAITVVPAQGVVLSPCSRTGGPLRRWQEPEENEPPTWEQQADYVVTTPRGFRRKAGWFSPGGWVALLRDDATFFIQAFAVTGVTEGCNVEVFTCADYLEMETVGPEVTLPPGGHVAHSQRWRLLPGGFAPDQWRQLDQLAGLTSTPHPTLHHAG